MFRKALSLMKQGDLESARKLFLELTESFPESEYAPHAYFQFGVLFLEEGKPDLAEKFFKEAVRYPPPLNVIYHLSAYNLALAQRKQGRHTEAAENLRVAIAGETEFQNLPCVREVAAEARAQQVK
jgi:TolA-binding protein